VSEVDGEPILYISDFTLATQYGGTPTYISPEGCTEPQREKSDVYSLGMTILQMFVSTDIMVFLLYDIFPDETLIRL